MYLKKLEELSRYLVVNDADSTEICRFLNFGIFNYLECRAVYFAELSNDGRLHPVADFGFTSGSVQSWGSFPLTAEIPITSAVRRDRCVQVNSPEEMYKLFPIMKDVPNLDHDWKSILAIPLHAYGVFSITTFLEPKIDDEHECFLRTVGQLASVAFSKSHLVKRLGTRAPAQVLSKHQNILTPRQEIIRKMIEQGLTNRQIAEEIGFSDSLVRQETMAIYSILNVAGRKDLLDQNSK